MEIMERSARVQFTVPVHCPQCGQHGSEIWEENAELCGCGPQPRLIACSGEFYEGPTTLPHHAVVCRRCGAALAD